MKKSFVKQIWIALGIVAFLILLAPTLFSTKVGKQFLLNFLSSRYDATINAKNITLNWLGSQEIEEIAFENANAGVLLTCDHLKLEENLISILVKGILQSSAIIENLNLELRYKL